MSNERMKRDVWEDWLAETVFSDIRSDSTPDPVAMVESSGEEVSMTDDYDQYRLGRGRGDYLYMLYLLEEPVESSTDIVPVYIGESENTASRLLDHFRRLKDALPTSEWEDDGSWGSYGKYDHIATVYERADSPIYVWIGDVDALSHGPYGYSTYREELEAKMVGLAHSTPKRSRVFANREFVPNRVAHEMGKVGAGWVDFEADNVSEEAEIAASTPGQDLGDLSKAELWHNWVEQTILEDIQDAHESDPIPLFETDDDLTVELTEMGSSTVLKRSREIDARIRREGKRCVHADGVKEGPDGLLYVMYHAESDDPGPKDIIPRYIGKGEAYGKKNELSANFEEIAKDRESTRSFARWGDGGYWHVGELSETVFGEGTKKLSWASELFKQGTHQLNEQLYLWIQAWDPTEDPGPYGYPAYLAEVEGLLIGLAHEFYPEQLLNHKDVPTSAPANQQEFTFEPASK